MQHSLVTYEKPIPHLGLSDWYAKQWENQQTNDARRSDAFNLRHEARQLRNETRIGTEWDTHRNNARLADRVAEVARWRDTLRARLERVNREMSSLREEKLATEKDLDGLGIPFSVVSECISMRDCRLGAELTHDDGDTELKKELCVLETVKQLLIEKCQSAWEKLNKLEEVRFKLTLDIGDKDETIEIDKDQLTLDRNCANISYKTDPARIPKNSVTYETWLEQSHYAKHIADKELEDSYKLRELLFVTRERSRNDMRAQRDYVDFTLRKRIYETQRARNELEWQQLKMREESEKVLNEIRTLEEALRDKDDARKLCETRLENRCHRPGYELAWDEPQIGLKDEMLQLAQVQRELVDKMNCAKATYNALEDRQVVIDRDLSNKSQSLMTDVRCLDLRARLKTGGPATQTDRNLVLTKMQKEIVPT